MSLFDDASLVLIPDGAKDGKLYPVKPTDGGGDFTFSRGSNLAATMVNENGLIEKGRENLFLYSEEFDDAVWVKSSGVTITANQATSPDGTTTADQITRTTSGNAEQSSVVTSGQDYVFSCFAKADDATTFSMVMTSAFPATVVVFNFSDGSGSATTGTPVNFGFEDYGNGWYRFYMVQTANASSTGSFRLLVSNNTSAFIWGAQLEVGSVATEYIKSTSTTGKAGVLEDLPRIDYSEGGCPSLLLEPQRTNLSKYSEDFSNSDWIKNNLTISSNATTAPDGTVTADKATDTIVNSEHIIYKNISETAGTYVSSVYLKEGNGARYIQVATNGVNSANWASIIFDIQNGTFSSPQSNGSYTLDNYDVEVLTNGWYRVWIVTTNSSDTYRGIRIRFSNSATPTYSGFGSIIFSGSGADNFYLWGAQLEAGSYPTSYIPTNGAAVTRNADSCVLTGVADLIGDSEGTLYFEGIFSQTNSFLGISDNTSNNRVFVGLNVSGNLVGALRNAGTDEAVIFTSGLSNTTYKVAFTYESNRCAFYINGVKIGEDLSVNTFTDGTLFRVALDDRGANPLYGNVKQLTVFPTALTDTELENLTS